MEIKDIRKLKEELEIELLTKIREFEQKCSITVSKVEIQHAPFMGRGITVQLGVVTEI